MKKYNISIQYSILMFKNIFPKIHWQQYKWCTQKAVRCNAICSNQRLKTI